MHCLLPPEPRIIKLVSLCLAIAWLFVGLPGPGLAMAEDSSLPVLTSPSGLPGPAFDILLDEEPCQLHFLAFQDKQGSPLLSLSDCRLIFGMEMSLDDLGNLVLESNQHHLLLPASSYLKFASWTTLNNSSGEPIRLDIIYVPLEPIAQEWQYQINISPDQSAVMLNSPGFKKEVQPDGDLPLDGLPGWGSFAAAPAMNNIWTDEAIVGGYYTTITNSSANRINNIILSCSSINGRVLAPGEVFSFNRAVGQRTTQRGYKIAPVYSGNKVVSGVGGGICQTSTTLYNAARESGMQVTERHHHTLPVHYIASGNDATVSWGTADFRFRNRMDYPVKIMAQVFKNHVIIAFARAD